LKVAGVDLAASSKKPTYCCFLRFGEVSFAKLRSDGEILEALKRFGPELAVVDAPLSLPEPGRSFRTFELEAIRRGAKLLPLSIKSMALLAERGAALARALRAAGVEVLETHPHSAAKRLGFKSTKELAKAALELELSKGEADALACCAVGVLAKRGEVEVFEGDPPFVLPAEGAGLGLPSLRLAAP